MVKVLWRKLVQKEYYVYCNIMNNPKYKQLISKVKRMAEESENIRAVFIIGSCVRANEKADVYSDIDFVVVAKNIDTFIHQKEWIKDLGNPLFVWTDHEPGWASWDRRILFDDFLESDFVLFNKSQFEQEWLACFVGSMLTKEHEILIDKDNIISLLKPYLSSDEPPVSNEKIMNEINDYFFHCNWIKKKMDRGALFIAHKCLNEHMKNKLLFMIECYAKVKNGNGYNTWFEGRFIEKWADNKILDELENCFATYNANEILTALKNQIKLYKSLSKQICEARGLHFPSYEVNKTLLNAGLVQ